MDNDENQLILQRSDSKLSSSPPTSPSFLTMDKRQSQHVPAPPPPSNISHQLKLITKSLPSLFFVEGQVQDSGKDFFSALRVGELSCKDPFMHYSVQTPLPISPNTRSSTMPIFNSITKSITLNTLPDELLLTIMSFLPDTDITTLSFATKQLRRISLDQFFWRREIKTRNEKSINARLFTRNPQRPSRSVLADRNIMRGGASLKGLLAMGSYVGSVNHQRHYEIQKKLDRFFVSSSLRNELAARPEFNELIQRGVIDQEVAERRVGKSLVPPMLKLKRAFKSDTLRTLLKQRKTRDDLVEKGNINKTHVISKSLRLTTSAVLLGRQVELEKRLLKKDLLGRLSGRPSVFEVVGVLKDARLTASMLCPSVRPKILYFEGLIKASH